MDINPETITIMVHVRNSVYYDLQSCKVEEKKRQEFFKKSIKDFSKSKHRSSEKLLI